MNAPGPPPALPDRRDERQMAREEPELEKYDGGLDRELQKAVANQIAGAQAKDAQQRQHKERVDQVGQRFRCFVNLHHPAQIHTMLDS